MKLKEALNRVGKIDPVFDVETSAWTFESPHFPHLEAHGESAEEVISLYQKLLEGHLKDLDSGNVSDFILRATPGWGGRRQNAGRPRGTANEPKIRKMVPKDIAQWLDDPEHVAQIRQLMRG